MLIQLLFSVIIFELSNEEKRQIRRFWKKFKKTCASGISFTLTNINKTYSILAIQKRLVEV